MHGALVTLRNRLMLDYVGVSVSIPPGLCETSSMMHRVRDVLTHPLYIFIASHRHLRIKQEVRALIDTYPAIPIYVRLNEGQTSMATGYDNIWSDDLRAVREYRYSTDSNIDFKHLLLFFFFKYQKHWTFIKNMSSYH